VCGFDCSAFDGGLLHFMDYGDSANADVGSSKTFEEEK
jgi:hypothetical protein